MSRQARHGAIALPRLRSRDRGRQRGSSWCDRATRSARPDRFLGASSAGRPASSLTTARPQEQASTMPTTSLPSWNEASTPPGTGRRLLFRWICSSLALAHAGPIRALSSIQASRRGGRTKSTGSKPIDQNGLPVCVLPMKPLSRMSPTFDHHRAEPSTGEFHASRSGSTGSSPNRKRPLQALCDPVGQRRVLVRHRIRSPVGRGRGEQRMLRSAVEWEIAVWLNEGTGHWRAQAPRPRPAVLAPGRTARRVLAVDGRVSLSPGWPSSSSRCSL